MLSTKAAAQFSPFISSGLRNHVPTLIEMQNGTSDSLFSSDTIICVWLHGPDTFTWVPKWNSTRQDPTIDSPFDFSSHLEINGEYFDRFWIKRPKGSRSFSSGWMTIDFYGRGSVTPVFSWEFPVHVLSARMEVTSRESAVRLYPNPLFGSATLAGDSPKNAVTLISEAGNVVREFGVFTGQDELLNFEGIASGVYRLRLADSRGVSMISVVKK